MLVSLNFSCSLVLLVRINQRVYFRFVYKISKTRNGRILLIYELFIERETKRSDQRGGCVSGPVFGAVCCLHDKRRIHFNMRDLLQLLFFFYYLISKANNFIRKVLFFVRVYITLLRYSESGLFVLLLQVYIEIDDYLSKPLTILSRQDEMVSFPSSIVQKLFLYSIQVQHLLSLKQL